MSALSALAARAYDFAGAGDRRAGRLVLVAALGVFFAADDQTSVVAVLPKMIEGISLPQDQFYRAAWIINGYILGYVIAMPVMGRVSDRLGHGRVFAASLAVFMAGSAWVALSRDLTTMALARGFQAVGGGALVPVAMAIVADAMPAERRGLGIGVMAAASEGGGLIGPLWGGGIAHFIGWQGLFWINLPMCLPLAIAAWSLTSDGKAQGAPIDLPGGVLFGASLVCLTVALTNDPVQPRPASMTVALYLLAAASFAVFIVRQTHVLDPLLEVAQFRRVPLSAGFVTIALHGGVSIVAMVNVPLFTNVILHGSALEGGLNLMRMTVGVPIGAVVGGYAAVRFGFNRTAIVGEVLTGIGFLGMAAWDSDPGFVAFTLPLFVGGIGLGLMIAPMSTAVMNEVAEGRRASVSSLLTVVDLLGSLVGVALLTTRGLGGFYASAGLIPLDDPRYTELLKGLEVNAFSHTFVSAAIICFVAIVPAALLGRGPAGRLSWKDVWALP